MNTTKRRASALAGLTLLAACGGAPNTLQSQRDAVVARNAPLREASLAPIRAANVGGKPLIRYVHERTAYVLDGATSMETVPGPSPGTLVFGGMADGKVVTREIGTATALTDDGYFVTAAHCVSTGRALLIRTTPGRPPRESDAVVVWSGRDAEPAIDVAVLWAPGLAGPGFTWSPDDVTKGATLLCSGSGARGLPVAGGTFVERDATGHVLTIEAPLLPGDSGGPCVLADGTLLGVCSTVAVTEDTPVGTVVRPDTSWLADLVQRDRTERASAAQPKARLTTAGMLRATAIDAEIDRLAGPAGR